MAEDVISPNEVRAVLGLGTAIEAYPEDMPYPSRLMLGWIAGQPVHVVIASAPEDIIVVTAYRPDPGRWDETFTIRKPR